eukprot:PhF_6_TR41055/c0_g1_i1/m.62183
MSKGLWPCYISIPLPVSAQLEISSYLAKLSLPIPPFKQLDPTTYHISLSYTAMLQRHEYTNILETVKAIARKTQPFFVQLDTTENTFRILGEECNEFLTLVVDDVIGGMEIKEIMQSLDSVFQLANEKVYCGGVGSGVIHVSVMIREKEDCEEEKGKTGTTPRRNQVYRVEPKEVTTTTAVPPIVFECNTIVVKNGQN